MSGAGPSGLGQGAPGPSGAENGLEAPAIGPPRPKRLDLPRPELEQLYQLYSPVVARVCGSILRRSDLAEDAAQEVFVHLLARDGAGRPLPDSNAWYVQVARHQALLIARRESARTRHEGAYAADRARNDSSAGDETTSWRSELLAYLLAIVRLRPSQRYVVDLYRHGLKQAEIAKVLGLSTSAVQGRLARAVEHLQHRFPSSTRCSLAPAHSLRGPRGRGSEPKGIR